MILKLDVGLELRVDTSSFNLFHGSIELVADKRKLGEMEDVVFDKDFLSTADKNMVLYYMYRNVFRQEDKQLFESHGLRYDITIMPPILLGKEFNKTAGHYHPKLKGLSYTEVYEVLLGEAHFLLQKLESDKVIDVLLVKAKKGDKVIIPPNYGHITINPSSCILVMANLVSTRFSSLYNLIKQKGGGAYFELQKNKFVKNTNYADLPELKIMEARKIRQFPLTKDIYTIFLENPSLFEFLNRPERLFEIVEVRNSQR